MIRLRRSFLTVLVAFTFALVPSRGHADSASGTAVSDWNATAVQLGSAEKQRGPAAVRTLAIMHVAIYDAVQALSAAPGKTSYRLNGAMLSGIPAGASLESATAAAARTVLLGLMPGEQPVIDTAYTKALSSVVDSTAKSNGVLVGSWIAGKILAWRATDNFNFPVIYQQPDRVGTFQTSAPTGAANTYVPYLTPFVLTSASQFRAPPPPALTSAQYAADYNEAKSLGAINSTTRTADQTQIALFWFDDDSYMWNTVARTIAAQQGDTLLQDARLFAELNVAMTDGLIATFDSKYLYNFWLPEPAIHVADADGNSATAGDPTWAPLKPTPAHPDYPSAHTANGAAASTVLASFFGTDQMSFSFTTRTVLPANAVRSFTSFSQASTEEGLSRIWVGYHFRT